jgi:hypothetical protein
MKIIFPDRHLGFAPGAYAQSYPQILWVNNFLFSGKVLTGYAKIFSSISRQAYEPE